MIGWLAIIEDEVCGRGLDGTEIVCRKLRCGGLESTRTVESGPERTLTSELGSSSDPE
jgi:hypothetical protein